ncbi:MAG TPA: hypothetical protein VGQ19_12400, partial [Burkholderiales bacterium]|nr:hypothetical protein [Burkholderiales bacterium]
MQVQIGTGPAAGSTNEMIRVKLTGKQARVQLQKARAAVQFSSLPSFAYLCVESPQGFCAKATPIMESRVTSTASFSSDQP